MVTTLKLPASIGGYRNLCYNASAAGTTISLIKVVIIENWKDGI